MAVPIVYVETFPGPASADGDGASLALFADNGTNQHQTILATVGGLMTVHIYRDWRRANVRPYNNIPIISTIGWRSGCNSKHQRQRGRIYPLDSGSGGHSRLRLHAQFLWRKSCTDRHCGAVRLRRGLLRLCCRVRRRSRPALSSLKWRLMPTARRTSRSIQR